MLLSSKLQKKEKSKAMNICHQLHLLLISNSKHMKIVKCLIKQRNKEESIILKCSGLSHSTSH